MLPVHLVHSSLPIVPPMSLAHLHFLFPNPRQRNNMKCTSISPLYFFMWKSLSLNAQFINYSHLEILTHANCYYQISYASLLFFIVQQFSLNLFDLTDTSRPYSNFQVDSKQGSKNKFLGSTESREIKHFRQTGLPAASRCLRPFKIVRRYT